MIFILERFKLLYVRPINNIPGAYQSQIMHSNATHVFQKKICHGERTSTACSHVIMNACTAIIERIEGRDNFVLGASILRVILVRTWCALPGVYSYRCPYIWRAWISGQAEKSTNLPFLYRDLTRRGIVWWSLVGARLQPAHPPYEYESIHTSTLWYLFTGFSSWPVRVLSGLVGGTALQLTAHVWSCGTRG